MELIKRQPLNLYKAPVVNAVPGNIVKLKSFNEPGVVVDFDPVTHAYSYDTKPLIGATTFLKKFYKVFQLEIIAKTCAKLWGVSAQSVIDLWESNKNTSALLGKSIHDALEHYEQHQELGEAIRLIKGDEDNYALPKHPLLRKIIKDFIALNPVKGKVMVEQLVTDVELGYCGQADRIVILDEDKKTCRIGDYKINVDAEAKSSKDKALAPFDTLPANKITKYQLQMSIYANMLQKSGWTVTGLDVYILEDEWKHFDLEVLKVI